MQHTRDFPFAGSSQQRRERLFELCHQQQRAATASAASIHDTMPELSEEDLDAIRARAVGSFARPA